MSKKKEPYLGIQTGTSPYQTTKAQRNLSPALKQTEEEANRLLVQALDALNTLAQLRLKCKLSNSRVSGVARELKELIKVMSVYNQTNSPD